MFPCHYHRRILRTYACLHKNSFAFKMVLFLLQKLHLIALCDNILTSRIYYFAKVYSLIADFLTN